MTHTRGSESETPVTFVLPEFLCPSETRPESKETRSQTPSMRGMSKCFAYANVIVLHDFGVYVQRWRLFFQHPSSLMPFLQIIRMSVGIVCKVEYTMGYAYMSSCSELICWWVAAGLSMVATADTEDWIIVSNAFWGNIFFIETNIQLPRCNFEQKSESGWVLMVVECFWQPHANCWTHQARPLWHCGFEFGDGGGFTIHIHTRTDAWDRRRTRDEPYSVYNTQQAVWKYNNGWD